MFFLLLLDFKLTPAPSLALATPETTSDLGLVRFLRGYVNDLAQASQAFITGAEWRNTHNVAKIRDFLVLKQSPVTLKEIIQHYTNLARLPHWEKIGSVYPERVFCGQDKHGNPIMVTSHEMIDNVFALVTCVSQDEFDEFRIARAVNLELYLDALSTHYKLLIKCVYVWNLSGMTRNMLKSLETRAVKRYFGDFDTQLGTAFPEQVFRVICLNVPTWLMILWSVAKRVVPGRTMKKISVYPTASELWTECEIKLEDEVATREYRLLPRLRCDTVALSISFGCTKQIDIPFTTPTLFYSMHVVSGGGVMLTVEHLENGKRVHQSKPFRVDDFYQGMWNSSVKPCKRVLRLVADCRGASSSSSFFGFAAGKSIEVRSVPYTMPSVQLQTI